MKRVLSGTLAAALLAMPIPAAADDLISDRNLLILSGVAAALAAFGATGGEAFSDQTMIIVAAVAAGLAAIIAATDEDDPVSP